MARMALITPYRMALITSAGRCTISTARAQLLPPPRIALRVALLNDLCHAAAVLATDAALVEVAMLLLISHHTTQS